MLPSKIFLPWLSMTTMTRRQDRKEPCMRSTISHVTTLDCMLSNISSSLLSSPHVSEFFFWQEYVQSVIWCFAEHFLMGSRNLFNVYVSKHNILYPKCILSFLLELGSAQWAILPPFCRIIEPSKMAMKSWDKNEFNRPLWGVSNPLQASYFCEFPIQLCIQFSGSVSTWAVWQLDSFSLCGSSKNFTKVQFATENLQQHTGLIL